MDETTTNVNKELSAARAKCVFLRSSPSRVLVRLKILHTDLMKSLECVLERTKNNSCVICKELETESAQGLKLSLAKFECEVVNVSGGVKTFFSEFTSGAQHEIAIFVPITLNRSSSVCESDSIKPSTPASVTITAAAGIT